MLGEENKSKGAIRRSRVSKKRPSSVKGEAV